MRAYDLVVILKTSLTEEKRKKLLDTIKTWIKDAKISKEELIGTKVLSYTIKRQKDGFYVRISFEAETVPLDLGKRILAQEDIIRHLLIRNK